MKNTVLVTGASSGFGRETVKLFSKNGWNVIATMRSPEKDTELAALDNVLVTKLDVTNTATIQDAVVAGIQKFGKIDVLVNNAGYGSFGSLEASSEEDVKRQFDVNVFGLINVTKAVLPGMREHRSGTIINISSVGGRLTFPFSSLYHATKFAVEGLTESLLYELNPLGINLKIIEPGGYKTEFAGTSINLFGVNDVDGYKTPFNNFMQMIAQWPMSDKIVEVAEAIYTAATDGTETLRYPVGHDAGPVLQARIDLGDIGFKKMMSERTGI